MKVLNFIGAVLTLFNLIACQPKTETEVKTINVPSTPTIKTEIEKQKYERIYYFDNYSVFEIQSNELGELYLYTSNQEIKTLNGDGTLAFHPIISGNRLREVNKRLFWYTNVSYSATHNLKEDVSGAPLTGVKLTEFTFQVDNSGLGSLKIVVYNNNLVVVNRTIDELP